MSNSIQEVIDLIKKTNDNCVIIDSQGQPAFVVLPFKVYKKMVDSNPGIVDLTEEELLDKINRDIALWKESQKEAEMDRLEMEMPQEAESFEEEVVEKYYFEPIE
jgi:cysteinyl-tRNA synthetase